MRHWLAQAAGAVWRGDTAAAPQAAREQATTAQRSGLLEWLTEALLLIGRFGTGGRA